MAGNVGVKRALCDEGTSPPPSKRATSSSPSPDWQEKMIRAAAHKARLCPRPRRLYKDGIRLMAQEFLDDRLMECDGDDATEADTGDGDDDAPHTRARSSQRAEPKNSTGTLQDTKPKDGTPESSQSCLRQIRALDFELPRLRRCPFDLSTMVYVGPIHPRSDDQTWHLERLGEPMMHQDGGFDGYNFKIRLEDDGPAFVLKVFYDQEPPEPPCYYALQRECQNAAVFQLMQAALARTDDVGPVLIRPEPPSWDAGLENMRAFSDEYRRRSARAQAASGDEGSPSQHMKQLTWMPRIRRCYGWTRIPGCTLYELLPRGCWPCPVVLNGMQRELRRDCVLTALVYEYVEEAPNDRAALEAALAFYRDAGFSHTPVSLESNWKGGVLVDGSDIVAACSWGWIPWRISAKGILSTAGE